MSGGWLLTNGTIVPMDKQRTVIAEGYVQILDGRITAIGSMSDLNPALEGAVIDVKGGIILPGLIDLHLHAGHALTRNLGNSADQWMKNVGDIYSSHVDEDFWAAEAALSAFERIRGGTTTSVPVFGGGDNVLRTDDTLYCEAHLEQVVSSGLRHTLVLGSGRPPFPKRFTRFPSNAREVVPVTLARQIEVSKQIIERWSGAGQGRITFAVSAPVVSEAEYSSADTSLRSQYADCIRSLWELSQKAGVPFAQDGHREGSISFMARTFGIFDERSMLAHCINLTSQDVEEIKVKQIKVVFTPSSLMAVYGRCPAPELLQAGVCVGLATDGPAPDRPLDMFRNMFMAHRLQAWHARDETVLSAWQILEMATIKGAEALGLDHEIGSLKVGKKADIVVVDTRGAHIWPLYNPVERLVFYAGAADVTTVMVDGRVLMRDRIVLTLDDESVRARAAAAFDRMIRRWNRNCLPPALMRQID